MRWRGLGLTVVSAWLGVAPVMGQTAGDGSRIVGRVVEHGSVTGTGGGRGIASVLVTLAIGDGDGVRVVGTVETDRTGRFEFRDVPAGLLGLKAERLGYMARTDSVRTLGAQTVDVIVTLSAKVVALDPLVVTVRSRWLELNGFYERRESGMKAHVIDRMMIEKRMPQGITELLDEAAGVNVFYLEPGRRTIRFNRHVPMPPEAGRAQRYAFDRRSGLDERGCEPDLYIDGRRHRNNSMGQSKVDDYDAIPVAAIEAVEVYVGNTPAQFHHACGVILIWTRRGAGAD